MVWPSLAQTRTQTYWRRLSAAAGCCAFGRPRPRGFGLAKGVAVIWQRIAGRVRLHMRRGGRIGKHQ
eukprot:364205-Chlamydomonas_euryale.AAC.4